MRFISGLIAPNQGLFHKYDSALYRKEEKISFNYHGEKSGIPTRKPRNKKAGINRKIFYNINIFLN